MNDTQIRCFLEAAKEQNFSRAAQTLYLSQPALSRHIATMERELNVKLFSRTANKRVRLTKEGETFFNLFSRFMMEYDELKDKYAKIKEDPFGNFSFGYLKGWDISFFLKEMLETFEKGHPGVSVSFESLPPFELIYKIENKLLDVALIPWEYIPNSPKVNWEYVIGIQNHVLFSDRFLSDNADVKGPQDLQNTDFFFTQDSMSVQREDFMNFIREEMGYTPNIVTLPNDDTLTSFVNAGMGVMLTDSLGTNIHSQGYHSFPLKTPRKITLVWPSSVRHNLPYQIVGEIRDILLHTENRENEFYRLPDRESH